MEHIMPRYDAHRPIEGARERSNDLIVVAEEGRTASPLVLDVSSLTVETLACWSVTALKQVTALRREGRHS